MEERYLKVALLRSQPKYNTTEYVDQAFLYWSDDINSLYELLLKYLNEDLDEEGDSESFWTLKDIKKVPIRESGANFAPSPEEYWIELPGFMDINDF